LSVKSVFLVVGWAQTNCLGCGCGCEVLLLL
jgi:hypothetical protein